MLKIELYVTPQTMQHSVLPVTGHRNYFLQGEYFLVWSDITSLPAAEFATTEHIVNLSSLLNISGLIWRIHLHTKLTKVWL